MTLSRYPDWLLDIVKPGDVCASDEAIMTKAIELAGAAFTQGKGGPFGALIATAERQIVAVAHNEVRPLLDSTAHAEVLAIRRAQQSLDSLYLRGDDLPLLRLFTTCEPCLMCLGAIYWARVPVVIAAARKEDARQAGLRQEGGLETAAFCKAENIAYRADFLREAAQEIFRVYQHSVPTGSDKGSGYIPVANCR